MLRKLLILGVAALVAMTISAVVYGEAVAPQARSGNNLLKAAIEPGDTSQRRVETDSLVAVSFSKNTAFASSAAKGTVMMSANSTVSNDCEDSDRCGTVAAVPEPFSMVLLGTGLAGLAAMMRKRR